MTETEEEDSDDDDEGTVLVPDEINPLDEIETQERDAMFQQQQGTLHSWVDVFKWYRDFTKQKLMAKTTQNVSH
jgi:hypothetical protein